VELAAQFTLLYGLVPLYLIGPPTLLMGMSFPFIQKAVQTTSVALGAGWEGCKPPTSSARR